MAEVPHLDCVVEEDNLREGVAKVLSVLRPDWDADKIELKDMSAGYANKNYAIKNGSDGLFLRLVNTLMPGFLESNVKSMTYLKRRKIGAHLLLRFNNGLVMELLDGEGITWDQFHKVKEPEIWRGIAREIARYHGTTNVADIKELNIMDQDGFIDFLKVQMNPVDTVLKEMGYPSSGELFEIRRKICQSLIEDGADFGFCHMDANPTNVLLTPNGPIFVDYDVCAYDLCAVNLANIFCSVTNIQKWNFDDYPNEEEKEVFIREYLRARSEIQPDFGEVDENLVRYWKFLVEKASLIMYATAVCVVTLVSMISPKPLDHVSLSRFFWNKYKENEKLVETRFSKE